MINKLRNLIYFLIVGWIAWVMEQLREGKKAKSEVLIDNYKLQKDQIDEQIKNESIDKLIDSTNALYRPSRKSGQEDK